MQTNVSRLPTLAYLAGKLAAAKREEAAARTARIAVEEEILAHPAIKLQLRDEGTVTAEGVKVTTKLARSWDQEMLAELAKTFDPAWFPFRAEWKEDRRASRVLEERFPDLARELGQALTLKPAKPAVSLASEG